jgi:hypothetical protein
MSPGTRLTASIVIHTPSLKHLHSWACMFFRASSALSALLSYHTATVALMIKMHIITKGSTKAVIPSSPSPVRAKIKEMIAAPSKIWTSKSLNYSRTRSNSDVSGSASSSLGPFSLRRFSASVVVRPFLGSV